jgi:uncharacterized protein (DUF4415 family)
MNKKTSSKASDCDLDEVPPWSEEDFSKATLRIGMKEVGREEFRRAVQARLVKRRVSIMLDAAVVEFFKAKAGGRGYQTLINAALLDAMRGQQLSDVVRETIREELRAA